VANGVSERGNRRGHHQARDDDGNQADLHGRTSRTDRRRQDGVWDRQQATDPISTSPDGGLRASVRARVDGRAGTRRRPPAPWVRLQLRRRSFSATRQVRQQGQYTDPTRLRATDPGHVEGNPVFL